jgi:D-alanyl-lipoteichoic acid acyltransferase DltB (MBOAT superfamily)
MDTSSFLFLGFAAVVILIYHLGRAVAWRQAVLFVANAAFLASVSRNWKSFIPMLGFLAAGYVGVRLLQARRSRSFFLLFVIATLVSFVWLKQYSFVPDRLSLHAVYVTIGLSYIFFRVLHMIIDAYGGNLQERIGVIPYLNYTLNFTTLIAGPIQTYPEYAVSQLAPWQQGLTLPRAAKGLERVAIGFFKVRVLSMLFLAEHAAAISQLHTAQSSLDKVLTGTLIAVTYPFYLYCNFSGYCDMMIGVACFLNLELPENFDRPFSSTSFLGFWGRWHMTLSNWLKAYLYTPMVKGMMRRFPSEAVEPYLGVIAFFVTFFLVGVWHGQTSEFVFYGLVLGLGISLNKLYQVLMARWLGRKHYSALRSHPLYVAAARGLTFTFFTFMLLWFWSSWTQLNDMKNSVTLVQNAAIWVTIFVVSTVGLALWEAARERAMRIEWSGLPVLLAGPVRAAWALYLFGVSMAVLRAVHVPTPILYRIF